MELKNFMCEFYVLLFQRKRLRNMRLSRLTKRLEEYQIALWTATPSLPLRLFGKNGKNYVFLVHTENTRESWIMAIKKMQIKCMELLFVVMV